MKGYHLDSHPQANVSSEHYAIVRIPALRAKKNGRKISRRKTDRCPESSVSLKKTKDEALLLSNIEEDLYAAKVIGPARSSEGCNIFYILRVYE